MKAAQKDRALWLTIANTMGDDARLTTEHAHTLRRAEKTLHRWAEEECNGTIQREGDQATVSRSAYGGRTAQAARYTKHQRPTVKPEHCAVWPKYARKLGCTTTTRQTRAAVPSTFQQSR